MDRPDAALIPPDTTWLTDANVQRVCAVVASAGFQIHFVGGCVRNALLGAAINDIDLATDALPEQVIERATAAGLKAVPTGIEHGTVTVIAGGIPFEVTTFRRDVQTDGRRAIVAFSRNIEDDARRRDFTMNALYATPQGRVVDPLGGFTDLQARRVRFIDDAQARIREDYLRVLRYFRFHGWYANPAEGFDPDALSAIASNLSGLETLSAERIGAEMAKLLSAPDPVFALSGMQSCCVLSVILPGSDTRLVGPLVHFEQLLGQHGDWRVRLAAMGGDDPGTRWRLSKSDTGFMAGVRDAAFEGPSLAESAYRQGRDVACGAMLLRAAVAEVQPQQGQIDAIEEAARARFPVSAQDLMPALKGAVLGEKLRALEQAWIDSGFTMTREDLLT